MRGLCGELLVPFGPKRASRAEKVVLGTAPEPPFGTTFGVTFWKVSCPGSVRGVATCLRLQKSIGGTSKADQLRLSADRRSSSLEKKIMGPS